MRNIDLSQRLPRSGSGLQEGGLRPKNSEFFKMLTYLKFLIKFYKIINKFLLIIVLIETFQKSHKCVALYIDYHVCGYSPITQLNGYCKRKRRGITRCMMHKRRNYSVDSWCLISRSRY